MSKKVVVFLAPGFEEIEAVTPIDVLRRAGLDVTTASVADKIVTGARGVPYQADCLIADIDFVPDAVILPGGMPGSSNLGECDAVHELTRKVNDAGGICAAICAAPAVALSLSGVLSGKRATCYPGMETQFPADVTHVEESVVVDGNIVTSRGPGTALAFSFMLTEMLCDKETAQNLKQGMLVNP